MYDLTDTDTREALKLDAYVPAPNGDTRPWWERVAEFGLTRAIDNQLGPAAPNKTSQAATYAGENGKTFTQPLAGQGTTPATGGNNKLLMWGAIGLAILGLGYVVLGAKKG